MPIGGLPADAVQAGVELAGSCEQGSDTNAEDAFDQLFDLQPNDEQYQELAKDINSYGSAAAAFGMQEVEILEEEDGSDWGETIDE